MKDANQIIESIKRQRVSSNLEQQTVVDDFAKNIIDKVFEQLEVIFPAWKQAWGSEEVKAKAKMEWTRAFVENDIKTIEQIKYGFKRARQSNSDFLPSCGKFISWCQPSAEDLGYPSEHEAMKECIQYRNARKLIHSNHVPVRPFIMELVKRVDWWAINNASTSEQVKKSQKHFKDVYMDMIENYIEPEVIDAPALPTEETVNEGMSLEQREAKQERAGKAIKEIRKKLKNKGK